MGKRGKTDDAIRVKAMCVIVHDGKALAGKGYDSMKDEHFWRVLGGSIHFGETAEDGVRREIKEELGCEIKDLKLLDVVENIFIYEGEGGHEVTFLFSGALADTGIYQKNAVHIVEDEYKFDAEWILVRDVLSKRLKLYPEYDYSKVFTAA